MGTHELKGDRGYQEDRVIALTLRGGERFIGCYDGHCGELCAQYCKDHLHETLQAQPTFGDDATVGEAFRQTFQLVNTNFIAGDAESRRNPEAAGATEAEAAGPAPTVAFGEAEWLPGVVDRRAAACPLSS